MLMYRPRLLSNAKMIVTRTDNNLCFSICIQFIIIEKPLFQISHDISEVYYMESSQMTECPMP